MLFISELKLISPIPPSVNHYLGHRAIIQYGRPVSVTYKTNEANKYQKAFTEYVTQEVTNQGWGLEPNDWQHFYVDADFYFDRIDKDSSNYWKCLLDAITDTKLIWLDDNVVCERVNRIYYDSYNPRVELIIRPVDYIGIFDDVSQLERFENHCISCSRYKRNCSILQKAKEGRIQPEITDMACSQYKKIKNA